MEKNMPITDIFELGYGYNWKYLKHMCDLSVCVILVWFPNYYKSLIWHRRHIFMGKESISDSQ